MKTLENAGKIENKKVILRLDLNVPCEQETVVDDYRIKKILPTLHYLAENGARTIIFSHIESGSKTLKPVFEYLKEKINISFAKNINDVSSQIATLNQGNFVMVENIRNEPGEEKNDPELAKRIADLGELYINDAFPVSHRSHASIVGVPKLLPSYAGPLFVAEVENLSKAFKPERPALFVLGGAKFDTKLPLVTKFLELYDHVFIGGALANDIFKAKGFDVGVSTVSKTELDLDNILKSPKLYIPFDVVVKTESGSTVKMLNDISSEDKIVDSGPKTGEELFRLVSQAKFVLWNGPLGQYEEGFSEGTEELASIIVKSGIKSTIGGGDTVAAAEKTGLMEKFSFVSTGGGAMLEFLAKGTLPGIKALEEKV